MPASASARHRTTPRFQIERERSTAEVPSAVPWLLLVAEQVKATHYGVVQIVIHDSKIVQIERTERTRFDKPQSVSAH